MRAVEEARLARLEEERRAAEEGKRQREVEEERQAAITLAEYQRKEAEKAEFKKQEGEVVALCKAKAKVLREVKAKVKKEVAARSESEKVKGLKKHRWEDGEGEISMTVRSFLTEHGVEWMVKEGVVCDSCEKKEKKCFWRMEARQDKACLECHDLKKSCVAGRAEESETEAGLLKKRKVEGKRKGKAKVGTPVSGVVESITVDVLQDILRKLKGLHAEVSDLHFHVRVKLEDPEADEHMCQ